MAEVSWEQKAALVAEALNLLVVLAVPRLYEQWRMQAPSVELRAVLGSRMTLLATFCANAEGSPDAERFQKATPKVQVLAEAVVRTPLESLSDSAWVTQARGCLDALGLEAPPGGWDTFEGWPVGSG